MTPLSKPTSEADWEAIAFEATQLFSPFAPIQEHDLFAGRGSQIRKMIESTSERGKHVILFGERGVGKTSLAKLFASFFPSTLRFIHLYRVQADPTDDFTTLWRKLFKDIHIQIQKEDGNAIVTLAESYAHQRISPDDVRRELDSVFGANHIPVVVIDEYDKIRDRQTHELMANAIKAFSDEGVNVTIVLVGVADNINELVGEHPSIVRCIEQVAMPRMTPTESREILDKIIPRLGLKIEQDALWKIVNLSRGMPSYVHALGLYAVQNSVERRALTISEIDVDAAIKRALERVDESFRDVYNRAIHSNRRDNLYKEVLLACALAETDERGTFTPLAVCKPLSAILKRDKEVEIATFQQHLGKFITPARANVLVQRGRQRAYRFRFDDPMMQPYVIMKGIEQGLVGVDATDILSYPAQPRLPSI